MGLVACGPAVSDETPATETATSAPALVTVEPTTAAEDEGEAGPEGAESPEVVMPEGAVIVFRRDGGIAGVSEEWTIFPDGRIEDGQGNTFEIEPEAVTTMLTAIEASGFMELDNSQPLQNICCDRFVYTLAVRLDDNVHTMQTVDGAENVPAGLTEAINAVQSVVERVAE
jgi:hypothetical protein